MNTVGPATEQFDPKAMNGSLKVERQPQRAVRVYDERIFLNVERYTPSTQDPNGHEWVIGQLINDPTRKVMVRLCTVQERMTDGTKSTAAELQKQYEGGERSREPLSTKAKARIKYIAFDGARPLGAAKNGIEQYRAHWPQTMASKPEAQVDSGMGCIVLQHAPEGSKIEKSEAYVEFLRSSTVASGDNIADALISALNIEDHQGNARDTHALLRIFHEGHEVMSPRVFPARSQQVIKDPVYGNDKTIMKAQDGATTYTALLEGKTTGIDRLDVNNDAARTIIAGLLDQPVPKVNRADPDKMRNIYYGIKNGHLKVEIVEVERIRFGPDTAKSYLKNSDNLKFKNYILKKPEEDQKNTRTERGYAPTVIAYQRFPNNGQPYVIFASPVENLPKTRPLEQFDDMNPLSNYVAPNPRVKEKNTENAESCDFQI